MVKMVSARASNGKKYFASNYAELKKNIAQAEKKLAPEKITVVAEIVDDLVTGALDCVMATPVIENPNHADLIEPEEKPKKKKIIKKKPKQLTAAEIQENQNKLDAARNAGYDKMSKALKEKCPKAIETHRTMTSMGKQHEKRAALEPLPKVSLEYSLTQMSDEQMFMYYIFTSTTPQLFTLRGGLEALGKGFHKISHMDRIEHAQALIQLKNWRGENHWDRIMKVMKGSKKLCDTRDSNVIDLLFKIQNNNNVWDDEKFSWAY